MSRAVAALALLLGVTGCSSPSAGIVDLDGHTVEPLPLGSGATVLVFLASTCPISTRYLPELGRIRERFAARGVAFDAVYPDAADPLDGVRAHAHDLGAGYTALRDPQHALVHRTGVTTTPEAAVLDARGALAYRGRIDDWYVDFGKSRPAATRHDLIDALDSVLAGRAAAPAGSDAIGCAISD